MACDSIVPNHHSSWPPSDTGLDILAPGDVLVQELQEVITLFLLETDDVPSELGVDV